MTEADRIKRMNNEGPFLIFHVEGGMGKNVLSTAVVEVLHKTYPNYKIVVATAWEAPFMNNPHVFRVFNFGEVRYFYDQYMYSDTKIFRIDPYHTEDHLHHRKHLIKTWCDLYNLPYNGEQPRLYLNPRELEIMYAKILPNSGKPIMMLQTNGGPPNQELRKSWARDLPLEVAQNVVDHFSPYYRILHIRREDQLQLNNVEPLLLNQRELYCAIAFSTKRLFIDSFAQHAAKALNLDSVVCWIGTSPDVFGYDNNINIMSSGNKIATSNKMAYFEEYDILGHTNQYPYENLNLFNADVLIEALKK